MGLTEEQKKLLENQSTENMLFFYEPEMRLIAEGGRANELINKKMVKRFIDIGILEHNRNVSGRWLCLSRKGREIYGLDPP